MTAATVDWRRVRAVVFDVDGTLYDQRALRLRMAGEIVGRCLLRPATLREARVLRTFRRVREELADEEAAGIGRLQYARAATRLRLPAERVEEVVADWILERPLRHVAACRRAGVRRLFAALRDSGRRIGVWSDYPAAAKLQAMDLDADAVVSAVDPEVDRMKPHPTGLARVLELLAVSPAEALMIGDRDERDGECARRLGCPYLLLVRRPSTTVELAGCTALLASLAAAEGQ
jgi:FMN phosphatase YigB (HAD superfamily)